MPDNITMKLFAYPKSYLLNFFNFKKGESRRSFVLSLIVTFLVLIVFMDLISFPAFYSFNFIIILLYFFHFLLTIAIFKRRLNTLGKDKLLYLLLLPFFGFLILSYICAKKESSSRRVKGRKDYSSVDKISKKSFYISFLSLTTTSILLFVFSAGFVLSRSQTHDFNLVSKQSEQGVREYASELVKYSNAQHPDLLSLEVIGKDLVYVKPLVPMKIKRTLTYIEIRSYLREKFAYRIVILSGKAYAEKI